MPLSPEQIQQMLSSINQQVQELSMALGASGTEGMEMGEMDLGDDTGDELQSWNARDVAVEPSNKPALLVDKSQFVKQPAAPVQQAEYMQGGMPEPDQDDLNYMPMDY